MATDGITLNARSGTPGATFPYLARFPFLLHCGNFRNNWHGKDRNHLVLPAWEYAVRLGPSYLQAPLGLQPWASLPFVDIDSGQNNLFFIFVFIIVFIFFFSAKIKFTVFVHHPFFLVKANTMAGGTIEFQP